MGEFSQRRLIRKLDLERFLAGLAPMTNPKVGLEQYTTSEQLAANMLYLAAYNQGDISGKSVLDLGCGTGRLALGALFLGAAYIVGVDIDKAAVKIAVMNSSKAGLKGGVEWVLGDIAAVEGKFDTVLQNPPFGVQRREADRAFLIKALEVGSSVYSLHSHPELDRRLIRQLKSSGEMLEVSASPFLKRFVEKHGGKVTAVYANLMTIPKMFDFHTKLRYDFVVDIYVIKKEDL